MGRERIMDGWEDPWKLCSVHFRFKGGPAKIKTGKGTKKQTPFMLIIKY